MSSGVIFVFGMLSVLIPSFLALAVLVMISERDDL